MAPRSIVSSIKNKRAIGKSEGVQPITRFLVLGTTFFTMLLGSVAKPLSPPRHIPTTRPKRKSEFTEAAHELWHSLFNWTFLMLIITPKPDVHTINEHRQSQSAPTKNTGFLSQLVHLFAIVWRLLSVAVKGAFAALQSPFTSKPRSQPSVLPQHIPPSSRADIPIEPTVIASSTTLGVPSPPDTIIQTPPRAVSPTTRVPKPDSPVSPNPSPTTAKFLATLTDLEAQMNNHQFYDLERELEDMDNHMTQMFDFSWMPRGITAPPGQSSPSSPISVTLPQAPPPARRDGKTIQILPMICEVSENSPDLTHTPPYDARWSIVTFQPLWGPRAQVGSAY
ncbi:unnamed protein product [Rhizoctonia solani]|uniref:Uncharacterized protein n=1 Tax=Rhizoctonia solani TaxID=456999 RepID=A0A8H3H3W0_9AGAM|nr:unnamed protein product [Rhizoctonia solani]